MPAVYDLIVSVNIGNDEISERFEIFENFFGTCKIYHPRATGPVTCVDSMDGCLIAAIGQKVFIHDLAENDLRAVGFVDTQIYTHCSYSFKHFCLIGDIQQGVALLRFQVIFRQFFFRKRIV